MEGSLQEQLPGCQLPGSPVSGAVSTAPPAFLFPSAPVFFTGDQEREAEDPLQERGAAKRPYDLQTGAWGPSETLTQCGCGSCQHLAQPCCGAMLPPTGLVPKMQPG